MKKFSPLVPAVLVGFTSFILWIGSTAQEKTEAQPRKIVFIAGKPSHGTGEHEHRAGSMLLADQMEKSGLGFQTTVVTNGWPEDESVFDGAAAVIIYSDGGGSHPAVRYLGKMRELTKAGVGIGCIHYAVEAPVGEQGGADTFLSAIGGFYEPGWSVNPHWEGSFKMTAHPVASGVKDFKILDEWYYHMRFREDMAGITPILTDLPGADTLSRPDGPHAGNPAVRKAVLEDKEPQHVMWVMESPEPGGGRGFGFTGGHFHKNWQNDDFRKVVLNAIAWIANTDIPVEGVPTKTPTDEEMKANLDKK